MSAASAVDRTGGGVEDSVSTVGGAEKNNSDEALGLEFAAQEKEAVLAVFLGVLNYGL